MIGFWWSPQSAEWSEGGLEVSEEKNNGMSLLTGVPQILTMMKDCFHRRSFTSWNSKQAPAPVKMPIALKPWKQVAVRRDPICQRQTSLVPVTSSPVPKPLGANNQLLTGRINL